MRSLRANLIRVAWESPQLRRPILALLREARDYDEYVAEKKRKKEKPLSKKEWEQWGKGKERLEQHGGKKSLENLRKTFKDLDDKQFDELVKSVSDMDDDEVKELADLAESGDTKGLREWTKNNLPSGVNDWVNEKLREEEQSRGKDEDGEGWLQDFGLGLLDWFSETIDKGKG